MASIRRTRVIKPGFFRNEELAELPFETRLCFAGLWTLADREGRVEDKPRRVQAELFPYDAVDMSAMLTALAMAGFIRRYVVGRIAVIEIVRFKEHQHPHPREQASELPSYQDVDTTTDQGAAKDTPRTDLTPAEAVSSPSGTSVSSGTSVPSVSSVSTAAVPSAYTHPPRRSGGVLEGMLPRDHASHAVCGRVCLLQGQFQQLVRKFGGLTDAAETAVRTWAEGVLGLWDVPPLLNAPIQGNNFAWWDARWEEWHGKPKAGARLTEDPDAMNAGVLELLRKDGTLS